MLSFGRLFICLVAFISPMTVSAQSNLIECGTTYTVARGDTLSRISARVYGVSAYELIYEANREAIGDDPSALLVGQALLLPCRGSATVTAVSATPEATTTGDPVTLTFNKPSAAGFVINAGIIDPYLASIEEATEGRVRFVDPDVINRVPTDQFDLVMSGEVDAAYVFNGYLDETHPLLQLPMIPLMGGSAEQTATSLWHLHENYLSRSAYFDDAHLLGFIAAPAAHVWRRMQEPVVAGEDIMAKNLYPLPYFVGLDTIGPQAVQERNAAMFGRHDETTNGSLTFLMAHGAARATGIWTPERMVTEIENGIYTPTFSVVMSNDAWARISPTDQAIINDLSGKTLSARSSAWDEFDNGLRQGMLDDGLKVAYPDRALLRELEEIAQYRLGLWSEIATDLGIPAQAAIAGYRADLASLRYLLIFR